MKTTTNTTVTAYRYVRKDVLAAIFVSEQAKSNPPVFCLKNGGKQTFSDVCLSVLYWIDKSTRYRVDAHATKRAAAEKKELPDPISRPDPIHTNAAYRYAENIPGDDKSRVIWLNMRAEHSREKALRLLLSLNKAMATQYGYFLDDLYHPGERMYNILVNQFQDMVDGDATLDEVLAAIDKILEDDCKFVVLPSGQPARFPEETQTMLTELRKELVAEGPKSFSLALVERELDDNVIETALGEFAKAMNELANDQF